MFELTKTFRFEAGHALIHHDGKCREPHGHSYRLTVHIQSDKLETEGPKQNMLMDFSTLSDLVNPMIKKYLDHQWLNNTLKSESPTAEFIAQWIFSHLKPQIPNLVAITIYETESSSVCYRVKSL